MKLLFTMCGRAGSKGVKNKNIRDFCGIPLPYYTLAAIRIFAEKHRQEYDGMDFVLSTDSRELTRLIGSVAPDAFLINRDASLAGDTVRKISVIRDAAVRAEAHFAAEYDMVVDLDITSPLRTLTDVERVVTARNTSLADVVYTVTEARRNPYFSMVCKKDDGFYSVVLPGGFATRQESPVLYDMNGSIYAYSRAYIHSDEPLFKRSDIVLMPDTAVLDIDSEDDHALMQVIAAYLYQTKPAYAQMRDKAQEMACNV